MYSGGATGELGLHGGVAQEASWGGGPPPPACEGGEVRPRRKGGGRLGWRDRRGTGGEASEGEEARWGRRVREARLGVADEGGEAQSRAAHRR